MKFKKKNVLPTKQTAKTAFLPKFQGGYKYARKLLI